MDAEEITGLLEKQADAVKNAVDRYMAESVSLKADLAKERKEREALEVKINRLGLGTSGAAPAEGKFTTSQLAEEHKAFGAFIARGDSSALVEMKAMSVGSDPNGGYIVLPALSASMNSKIFDQSPMKRLSRLVTIPNGDAWEEIDDHDEPDAEWVAEQQSRNNTDTPELGKLRIELHEIHASPKVTQKLLDTSYVDVGAWLEGKVADKFGRTDGVAFITGDGVGKPTGLLGGPPPVTTSDASRARGVLQYVPSGVAAALTDATHNGGDALIDLMYTLRAPYRTGAVWLMNSKTAGVVRKLKTSDDFQQYLWVNSIAAGQPPLLLGHPVEIDENMPDIGSNQFPIAFGNFKKGYVVVELDGIRVLRDPFTSKPHVVFYTYKRVGGGVAESDAIKLLKIASA